MFRSMAVDNKMSTSRSVRFVEKARVSPTSSLEGPEAVQGQVWKIQRLRRLPSYHPLAHNVLRISLGDDLTMDTITARISQFLRLHSIDSQFDNSGRVHATTSTLVEFSIQLWLSSTDGGIRNDLEPTMISSVVIVEVQRIHGDALAFVQYRRDLNEAITSGDMRILTTEASRCPSDALVERVDQLLSMIDNDLTSCDSSSSIEICLRLLESPSEHHWGLESLVALTDRSSTVRSEVGRASRFVLTDSTIQRVLMHHLVPSSKRRTRAFHVMTLRILAQALEEVPGLGLTLDWTGQFWQKAFGVFQRHISHCDAKPLEASLAIRCLRAIHQVSGIDFPNKAILRAAYRQGQQCHLALERESKWFLDGLGIPVL